MLGNSARKAQPSFSCSAAHFLDCVDFSHLRMFEFGSGKSTAYWGRRFADGELKSYCAVERNLEFWKLSASNNRFYYDRVACVTDVNSYLARPSRLVEARGGLPFDVTIFSALSGTCLAELAEAWRTTDSEGFIVVDDADAIGSDLVNFCELHSLARIDFAGFDTGSPYAKLTSVLFRNPVRFMGAKLRAPHGGI